MWVFFKWVEGDALCVFSLMKQREAINSYLHSVALEKRTAPYLLLCLHIIFPGPRIHFRPLTVLGVRGPYDEGPVVTPGPHSRVLHRTSSFKNKLKFFPTGLAF